MQISNLPSALTQEFVVGDEVALKIMLDLTVYLEGPSEQEFDYLFDLYESICPPGMLTDFKIAELPMWSPIADPILTMHGRIAAGTGTRRPYFEPARERIRQGRGFEAQYWDGLEIDDPKGSWSFNCQRIHLRTEGLFGFARLLLPLATDPQVLLDTALSVADNVSLRSGHGGLVFVYEPLLMEEAFDVIYARARRFWGVDIEHMNGTLPLSGKGIKGVNWLTLVGRSFAARPGVEAGLSKLQNTPLVTGIRRRHASVLVAGPGPVAGDQNRPDRTLAPYVAIADALKPLFLEEHPDFPGERFVSTGSTMDWVRRLIDPAGWR